jgi:hypothetical protein
MSKKTTHRAITWDFLIFDSHNHRGFSFWFDGNKPCEALPHVKPKPGTDIVSPIFSGDIHIN